MGWFHAHGVSSRPAVSILAKADGRPAGAGVLLPGRHLLTCAHVVNSALGKDMLAPDHPGPIAVPVRLHGPEHTVEAHAELTVWIPPRTDDGGLGAFEWNGDLAVLRLNGALPPAIEPPRWHPMAKRQLVRAWHGSGEPGVFADAEVSACDGRFGYFDGAERALDIEPAYSGGPLWSNEEGAVVGLVTAKLHVRGVLRRAWGIPWQRVTRELDDAGAGHLLPRQPTEDVRDHPAYAELVALLDGPLPLSEGWIRCCRTVARQCGLGHRADGVPSAEEFAQLLLTRGRALPALVEAVRGTAGPVADDLLAIGRRWGLPKLLSPGEHERLLVQLRALPAAAAAGVPGAVRASLPLAALSVALLTGGDGHHGGGGDDRNSGGGGDGGKAGNGGRFEALIAHVEGLHGDSSAADDGVMPAVPGLLRAVEFVAAGCCPADRRAALRRWNAAVARRLGVHDAALMDRRHDAEQWARNASRGTAPRVVARLDRCGAAPPGGAPPGGAPAGGAPAAAREEEPERYRLRLWCDDGDGLRQVSDDSERPRGAQEVAQEIFAAVGSLRRPDPSGPRPVIELIVDRDTLEVPVDRWKAAGPGAVLPIRLGTPYPLVVNCPELRELNGGTMLDQWRERWARLEAEEPVHIDDTTAPDPEAVCGLLMERLTARVTVDVAAHRRTGVVQMCLAAGVPVVLWDRSGEQGSPAVRHAAGASTRQLPEAVRTYRTKTLQRPDEYPGRPVLAWADAGRALPRLDLVDPTE
ncbi:trypsin-like peptidase domain-containing protein [Streptomyces sp. 110]|uniref:Trypsin-like peptidase domain-containing protein n=1 Tax=Streptomyces endocoffeicus TaxID=2898945 RepID=A0ABS1PT44_9ACTN|nr:trypsin-like peptidase domain-containing protein [Streptomyces endocoffeicus]MBL1115209.1 trypsin-like peptidase domain-containing protein [Streptomyces endocoffeicus]